jgi:hypothetical protein
MKHIPNPGGEAWIVTPQGEVRSVKYSSTVVSTLLDVKYYNNELGRPTRVRSVHLKREVEALGFRMLEALYEAEGIENGMETFLDFIAQCRRLRISRKIDDAYLPDAVIAMRSNALNPNIVLPPPAKGAAAKTEDSAASAAKVEAPQPGSVGKAAPRRASADVR